MRVNLIAVGGALLSLIAGCGQMGEPIDSVRNEPSEQSRDADPAVAPSGSLSVSTVSMTKRPDDAMGGTSPKATTPKGIANWSLSEITRLRAARTPDDPKAVAAYRRDRNRQIVNLATQAISATHAEPQLANQFNAAVHQLMETQLELALLGRPDDVDALFDTVRDLEHSHPNSKAAEEAGFTLARYAHANARRFAAGNPETLLEFSRQARIYADMYPSRLDRAPPVLYAAARSCEKHGRRVADQATRERLRSETRLCYIALKSNFASVHQGVLATAALRRLNLPGQKLTEFGGPTLDGRLARIEKLRGRIAVVVFWSSENEGLNQHIDDFISTLSSHSPQDVYLLGVNMDSTLQAARAYVRERGLPGSHIFYTGADEQRWENPLVRYWGIQDIPSIWIIDQYSVVVTTEATFEDVSAHLRQVTRAKRSSDK